ncbi:MAG: hypothetical protein Q8R82_09990, partial [Hyphomonadaceae bacterium]|nr:hypothetical protein [Hyphomonadaceae bacterium]
TAGLADAHAKLDLLIYLRACEIMGTRSRARDFKANRTASRSGRTPQACWRSFRRLIIRFEDYERLAQKRAESLKHNHAQCPLRLAATPQATSPSLRLVEAKHRCLASLTSKKWGRWIARPCAQDGGGTHAQPRGPPTNQLCPFQKLYLESPSFRDRPRLPMHHATSGNLLQLPPVAVAPPKKQA